MDGRGALPAGARRLEPGTLWRLVRERSARAERRGALLPIETRHHWVEDRGVRFAVLVAEALSRKDRLRRAVLEGRTEGLPPDPFLPYDDDLYVAHVEPSHLCLLNKFNVLRHHVLLVTREQEDQERLLAAPDFEALAACLDEGPALAFYNGGAEAGASQRHKHLQIVPLPLLPEAPEIPIEALLRRAPRSGGLVEAEDLPFDHRLAWLAPGRSGDRSEAACRLLEIYRAMLGELGVAPAEAAPDARQERPYNLLLTSEWMLAVGRSEETFEGISVNAIGFAGGLLVRSEEQLEAVIRSGPMTVLERVGRRRPGAR
jgi:ATP adenylyltransferase